MPTLPITNRLTRRFLLQLWPGFPVTASGGACPRNPAACHLPRKAVLVVHRAGSTQVRGLLQAGCGGLSGGASWYSHFQVQGQVSSLAVFRRPALVIHAWSTDAQVPYALRLDTAGSSLVPGLPGVGQS